MFLLSAFAKAWDAEAFADMLLLYGQPWFSIGAPLVICVEAVLGTALLLRVQPRYSALAADIFLISVSAVFAYGVVAKGIHDCGCFGALSRYYTSSPWMTFVRNAVFGLISIPALMEQPKSETNVWQKLTLGVGVAAIASFICGLAMRDSFELPKQSLVENEEDRAQTMEKLKAVYCYRNKISGEAMDALIASMSSECPETFCAIDTSHRSERNVITKSQVAAAKAKGWTVQDWSGGNPQEYKGSDE